MEAFERDDDRIIETTGTVVSDSPISSLADLTRTLQQKQIEVTREREPGDDDEPVGPPVSEEEEFALSAAADAAANGDK